MKTLCVFGTLVRAPVCPHCLKDDDVVVRVDGMGWTYHCENCAKDIAYDEIEDERY